MNIQILNNTLCLFPLCGALVGGYKGYLFAKEKKEIRWGKYAHNFYPNLIQIGVFSGLGFGIGYCISKLFWRHSSANCGHRKNYQFSKCEQNEIYWSVMHVSTFKFQKQTEWMSPEYNTILETFSSWCMHAIAERA